MNNLLRQRMEIRRAKAWRQHCTSCCLTVMAPVQSLNMSWYSHRCDVLCLAATDRNKASQRWNSQWYRTKCCHFFNHCSDLTAGKGECYEGSLAALADDTQLAFEYPMLCIAASWCDRITSLRFTLFRWLFAECLVAPLCSRGRRKDHVANVCA